MNDSEILARLIYRAFIGPADPGDSENMITFPMALALHARVAMLEELRNVPESGTDADDCALRDLTGRPVEIVDEDFGGDDTVCQKRERF